MPSYISGHFLFSSWNKEDLDVSGPSSAVNGVVLWNQCVWDWMK